MCIFMKPISLNDWPKAKCSVNTKPARIITSLYWKILPAGSYRLNTDRRVSNEALSNGGVIRDPNGN